MKVFAQPARLPPSTLFPLTPSAEATSPLQLGAALTGTYDYLGRHVYAGAIYDPYSAREVTAGQIDPVSGLMATSCGVLWIHSGE